jgi:hypothetical protein
MAKFFKYAFAQSGDRAAIPNPTDPSNTLTYQEGFSERYEEDLNSDPSALPIPRDQFNQLMNDVTGAVQTLEVHGVPDFISTADNDGVAYSYDAGAFVWYSGSIYQSLTGSNNTLPTDAEKWRKIDNYGQSIIYNNAAFEGTVANGNAVYWNNSTSEFTKAVANGTSAQYVIGIADVSNKRVYLSGYTPNLTGLTAGKLYYLSSGTPGVITDTPPSNNVVALGISFSTTALFLNINNVRNSDSQIFTSSGNFTVPVNVYKVFAKVKGGGGGGGASTSTENGTGGAGAGYTEGYIDVTPGDVMPVVVGAGGAAGTPGVGGGIGGDGGTSSFSILSATGGGGGPVSDGAGYGSGVGVGSGGTLNLNGQIGVLAGITSVIYTGGTGGLSGGYVAGSGVGALGTTGSAAPANSGGGGGGAGYLSGATIGGAGGSGIVEIYW